MMFLKSLFLLMVLILKTTDATICPMRAERRWGVEMTGLFTRLTKINGKYTPHSICWPSFNTVDCTRMRTGQMCTTEVTYRTGYIGRIKVPFDSDKKCFVKVQVKKARGRVKLNKTSFMNYCEETNQIDATSITGRPESMVPLEVRPKSNAKTYDGMACDDEKLNVILRNCVDNCFASGNVATCISTCSADNAVVKNRCISKFKKQIDILKFFHSQHHVIVTETHIAWFVKVMQNAIAIMATMVMGRHVLTWTSVVSARTTVITMQFVTTMPALLIVRVNRVLREMEFKCAPSITSVY